MPNQFAPFDDQEKIRTSLKTDSIEVAHFQRDAMEVSDDDYWISMLYLEDGEVSGDAGQRLKDSFERRYRSANSRAIARGFVNSPIEQNITKDDIGDLLDRLKVVVPVTAK